MHGVGLRHRFWLPLSRGVQSGGNQAESNRFVVASFDRTGAGQYSISVIRNTDDMCVYLHKDPFAENFLGRKGGRRFR